MKRPILGITMGDAAGVGPEIIVKALKKEDIYDAISMKTCVEKRVTIGAPGQEAMKQVIEIYRQQLAG